MQWIQNGTCDPVVRERFRIASVAAAIASSCRPAYDSRLARDESLYGETGPPPSSRVMATSVSDSASARFTWPALTRASVQL